MTIRFDSKKCTGCAACQMACMDQRDIQAGRQAPLRYLTLMESGGNAHYRCVGCVHCGNCIAVCQAHAIFRHESGLVLLDSDRCVGCGACQRSCPLGVISRDPDTGKAVKCDGCLGRVQAGLLPACVHTCPTGGLIFVSPD